MSRLSRWRQVLNNSLILFRVASVMDRNFWDTVLMMNTQWFTYKPHLTWSSSVVRRGMEMSGWTDDLTNPPGMLTLPVRGEVPELTDVPGMDCDCISFLALFNVPFSTWLSANAAWLWTNASAVTRFSARDNVSLSAGLPSRTQYRSSKFESDPCAPSSDEQNGTSLSPHRLQCHMNRYSKRQYWKIGLIMLKNNA